MRITVMVALIALVGNAAALLLGAATVSAQNIKVGDDQPFCTDKDELQEFLLSLLMKDQKWRGALKTCLGLDPRSKVVLIETLNTSDIMDVAKVRAFTPDGKKSVVGYTVIVKQ